MRQKRLVLVIEDDRQLGRQIKQTLEKDNTVAVRLVEKGLDGLWAAAEVPPHTIVLDLGLPDVDGTEICRSLRNRQLTAHIPIIIISERTTEQDRLRGFELGADDYVPKPFSLLELQARVRVALRRAPAAPSRLATYTGRHLKANFPEGVVTVDGRTVKLTRREFDLLWYLVEHRDAVIPPSRLVEAVWSDTDPDTGSRTLATHVARLRAKLGKAGEQIHTFLRKGYRFIEEADRPSS